MGPEQLSSVMHAVGKTVDPELKARIERESESTFGSARLWDDGIIPPAHTRRVLGVGLQCAASASASGISSTAAGAAGAGHSSAFPIRETTFGIFRM